MSQNLNFEIMLRAARLIDNSTTENGEEYKILSDLYNTHLNLCNGDSTENQNGVDVINHTEVANMC